MEKKYILFDLDGTLTDSKEGITKSVQYALKSVGVEEPDIDRLQCYIGPPLDVSLKKFHGIEGEEAKKAIEKYRERYKDKGIFENEVIDGIIPCLEKLCKAGKVLAVATCKPEVFAVRIIEHFGLSKYFTVITGSELDGTRKFKNEVIEEAFARLMNNSDTDIKTMAELKADALMVGDRNNDIFGAHEAGIEVIGVRFGYAEENELEEACADYIADTPDMVAELILSED